MPDPPARVEYAEELLSEYLVRVHIRSDLKPAEKFAILERLDNSRFELLLEIVADSLLAVAATDGSLRCEVEV
jgi:hypothetical protein